jgi:hypothetical protein
MAEESVMNSLQQLWIPIILSAVLVFASSSLIHMVLKWHNSDYRKLSNEDDVRAAIRAGSPAPGQYVLPHCVDMKDMQKPETQQKFAEGPVAWLVIKPSGAPKMGRPLVLWFVFVLAIGGIAAYVAARTLPGSASFLQVCRVVGVVSFLAYAAGSVQGAIWMGKPWGSAAKEVADGLIYAVITAVVFGWCWPH